MKKRMDLVRKEKKLTGKTWDDLSKGLPISGNALRVAFSRDSIDEDYLTVIEENLELRERTESTQEKPPEGLRFEEIVGKEVVEQLKPHLNNQQQINDLVKLVKIMAVRIDELQDTVSQIDVRCTETWNNVKGIKEVVVLKE